MEARLPEDKTERIRTALHTFQSKRSTTLQELQSLIGTLNFACKVIPSGRPFLQRIIELTRGVKKTPSSHQAHHRFLQEYSNVDHFHKTVEWGRAVPVLTVGHLRDPFPIHRCL